MIDAAHYLAEESARKQLTMPLWAVSALKDGPTKGLTKGIIAYEALMLVYEDFSDALTEVEAEVDAALGKGAHTFERKSCKNNKIKGDGEGRSRLVKTCEYPNPHEDAERTNVHLPVSLAEELPARGAGHAIAEALTVVEMMPWSSRVERIRCKQQLVKLAAGEDIADEDLHPYALAVRDGDDSEWEVAATRDALGLSEWHRQDDVSLDDIRSRGCEISQKARDDRVAALQTALNNAEETPTEDDLTTLVSIGFDVSERTAAEYVSEVSLSDDSVEIDIIEDAMETAADIARNEAGRPLPRSDAEVCLFDDSVTDLDREYRSAEEALESIEDMMYHGTHDLDRSEHGEAYTRGRKRARKQALKSIAVYLAELDLTDSLD
jgi:ribosomal protein L12E/L44/L45/RPP1/RPP2